MRLIVVTVADVSDWRASPQAKWSPFFAALAERHELIDVVRPPTSKLNFAVEAALSFHPERAVWARRFGLYPRTFDRRTRRLEQQLSHFDGKYDAIVQLQTCCAPGTTHRRYAIYTDNTYALTARHYPRFAQLPRRASNGVFAREVAVANGAARVFTMSQFARQSFIDDYGCHPSRVVAIGAGPQRLERDISTRKYDKPTALFVGLELERKGGLVLLESWRRVADAMPDAELVIVGAAPPPSASCPSVHWLGRVWDPEKLRTLFLEARLFVMPSLFEPWGLVFHEAMGHGLPCIGTDTCAMPEIIDDGATGLIVRVGDADSLADALVRLLSSPAEAEAMGREAHRRVLAEHAWTRVADRIGSELAAGD